MFANFLYFVIALLILTLYEPSDVQPFTLGQAFSLFLSFVILFGFYTWHQFRRLRLSVSRFNQTVLDSRYSQLITRHSILALVLLAFDVWVLHLPAFSQKIPWIKQIPTFNALVFLLVFVGYLIIIWFFSYPAYDSIYHSAIPRGEYIYSNFAFSVPILIPWLILSGITDLIQILPFEWPRRLLNNTFGQIGTFLAFLFLAAAFAPLLVQRIWRCRPLEPGFLRSRIEQLCRRAGVRYADIVYWPIFGGRMITAGVMGLVSRFRYIMVTNALLELLSPSEIDQVIAHEIGHIKRNHLLLYLLFFAGFLIISYASFMLGFYALGIVQPLIYSEDLSSSFFRNGILVFFLVISAFIYFRYIFGFFMRNFERQADIFVFQLFNTAQPLISTFGKIVASSGQPASKPNWHHFSIQQRVDYLRRCEQSPVWIERHDSKIRKSIAAYLSFMIVFGSAVFYYNHAYFDDNITSFNMKFLELYLQKKETVSIQDAPYFFLLGDYYLLDKQYQAATQYYQKGLQLNPSPRAKPVILTRMGSAYFEAGEHANAKLIWEAALDLAPDNTETLNNLAWLLATSPDPSLKNAQRALTLAEMALEKKQEAHILDTYATALFENGRIQEAIEAQRKALAMEPEDREIYEAQLARFEAALATMQK